MLLLRPVQQTTQSERDTTRHNTHLLSQRTSPELDGLLSPYNPARGRESRRLVVLVQSPRWSRSLEQFLTLLAYNSAMRIIASELAHSAILALAYSQRGLRLTELAGALQATPSAVRRALDILVADGLVDVGKDRQPRYSLRGTKSADYLLGLARNEIPVRQSIAIVARATGAVEFVGHRDGDLVVVLSATGTSAEHSRAAGYLLDLAERQGLAIRFHYHDDLRRELLVNPKIRDRMASSTILYGDLDQSVPRRSEHGVSSGKFLGRPHPALRLPSRRSLIRLKQAYGIRALALFGSAVRSDFRPDSDVDILVRFRPRTNPSLRLLQNLERDLEKSLGRDVDVIQESSLKPAARRAIETGEVRIA